MTDLKIELVDIDQLSLLENNPRSITKTQFDKLKRSLNRDPQFLNCRPILVNLITDTGALLVYAGNQRLRACKELGWNMVPCIIEDNLSKSVMKKRTILDNKTMGSWDYDELSSSFEMEDLLDCGFLEIELLGPEDIISDIQDKPKKEKKKKECPSCGHEF